MAGKVTVGLKHPNGVVLNLYRMEDYDELVMGGGTKTSKRAVQIPGEVRLHGTAVPFGGMPKCLIIGGYALTPDVDEDFMKAWILANKDSDLIKNHLLIVHEKADSAAAKAKEQRETRSGLEPLDPKKPPPGFSRIAPDDGKAEAA